MDAFRLMLDWITGGSKYVILQDGGGYTGSREVRAIHIMEDTEFATLDETGLTEGSYKLSGTTYVPQTIWGKWTKVRVTTGYVKLYLK